MRHSTMVLALALAACRGALEPPERAAEPERSEAAPASRPEAEDVGDEAAAAPATVEEPPPAEAPVRRIEPYGFDERTDVYWYDPRDARRFERDRYGRFDRDVLQTRGTLTGDVSDVDPAGGWIEVWTDDGRVRLRATPLDVAAVNPGDVVRVDYGSYRGVLWVDSQQAGDARSFAHSGTTTGAVGWVDRARGLVSIRGERFRAHPDLVDDIVPGEFVHLRYYVVGRTPWIAELSPA